MRSPRLIDGNAVDFISMSIDQSIVPLSTATMEVFKEDVLPIRTYVEIEAPNGIKEYYRTRQPQESQTNGTATIQLDHAICEVGDYLIEDVINEEMTVREAFVKVFSHYRGDKWQLGSFSASETVTLDVDYDNVLETMLAILEQQPKYIMTFNFSTSPWTVGIAEKSNTVTAEGRLSRNIADAVVRRDDKDLCTRVYVKGLPKPEGRESDENAIGYMDADTVSMYGIVEKQTGSGKLTEEQAYRVATAYLNAHKHPKLSVEIDGDDLSNLTGETLDSFVCGKKFRLVIPEDNLVIEDYITKVHFGDVLSPAASIIIGEDLDPTINFLQEQASSRKSGGRGAKKQEHENEVIHSEIYATGSMLYSYVERTATYLVSVVENAESQMGSAIYQSAEQIRTEVHAANSTVYSYINQTATSITSRVEDVNNDLHSEILQTQSMIRSAVWTANSQVYSYVDQTASYILDHVGERTGARVFTGMDEPVDDPDNPITPGDLWLEGNYINFWDDSDFKWVSYDPDDPEYDWTQLRGAKLKVWKDGKWQLAEDGTTMVEDTDLRRTKDQINLVAHNLIQTDGELRSNIARIDVKADKITSTVNERIADVGSRITQTAYQIRSEVHSASSQLYSAIEQTATSIRAYVVDEVNDLGSEILQTASQIRSEVHAAKSTLYSYVDQTATYIRSEVADIAGGLSSRITQTASQIRQEVANTTSSIRASITTEADRISLVVEGTGANAKIKPASIVQSINNGASSIVISANHINLDGYVKATDITADYIKGKIASISSVSMQSLVASSIQFSVGGGMYGNPANAIMNLQLYQSGNSYQIWGSKFNGEIVKTSSFSRAVSSWNWTGGNGQVKVTAQPQNQTLGVDVRVNGNATITSNGTYTYKAQYEDNNGSYWDIGGEGTKTITVSVPSSTPTIDAIVNYDSSGNIITNRTISSSLTLVPWAKVNGIWHEGTSVTITPQSRTDRGSGWSCSISGAGVKSVTLMKTFGAGETIPWTSGNSYHLYV